MTEEIVHLEPIEAIRQEALSLADPGELDRYSVALEMIPEIRNRHEQDTVRSILTRVNSVASVQGEHCKKYSSAYFKVHRAIASEAKKIIAPAVALRAKCESMLNQYWDRLEKQRLNTQQNLDELSESMREEAISKAQEAALAGDLETATRLKQEADSIITPILQASSQSLDGVAVSNTETVVIEDVMAFLQGIVSGEINLAVTLVEVGKKANRDAPVAVSVLQSELDANYDPSWPGCAKVRKRGIRVTRKDL